MKSTKRRHSMIHGGAALGAILIASLLGGCGNSAEPDNPEGTYRLTKLKGQALPYDHTPGCCIYTAGSLELGAQEYRLSLSARNKNNGMVFTVHEEGVYSASGTAIDFAPTSYDLPASLYGGQFEGRAIRVFMFGNGPGAADQFEALFER
jgi:hypothetical protein